MLFSYLILFTEYFLSTLVSPFHSLHPGPTMEPSFSVFETYNSLFLFLALSPSASFSRSLSLSRYQYYTDDVDRP